MILSKVISTELAAAGRRIIKALVRGRNDVRTGRQASPYGVDSNPVAGMVAIYSQTETTGKAVIIGYLNPSQLADVGELRTYSTDADGNLMAYTWLKSDGTIELGGNAKNLVRFQELETGFNKLRDDFNAHLDAFNSHVHPTAASGPPSIPTPGTGIPAVHSTADISDAKIDEIKTL